MSHSSIDWFAERGGYRAGVEARSDGLFQVHLERWVPGAIPEEPALWSGVKTRAVFSDSAQNARALAIEELNAVAPVED
ncbi:MAG TPA: hypothetical protein VFK05_08900 [Polyangiaceae bacterium]|nr:hypothetical protein [Polyangiaceae bacterium]